MLVSDLNLHNNYNYYYYNPNREIKEKTLELDMEEECKPASSSSSTEAIAAKVVDVEEGEISDADSVEEISEEDFNKQEDHNTVSAAENAKVKDSNNAINLTNNSSINSNNSNSNNQKNAAAGAARVWTMRDLYNYQISRNYAPGALYNLAWAQAVQNKPLDEVLIMEYPKSDDSNNKANLKQSGSEVSVNGENERIVIDVDGDVKEEGELEEGEIELDSEVVMSSADLNLENEVKGDGKGSELEKRVDLIRRGFESVTVDDAKKSFGEVCSICQNLADSLQEISLEDSLCEKDKLIQLLMTAIQTVNNVFCSMNQNLKEQNRDIFSRFLDHLTNQKPLLFSPEQLKEVEVMISYMDSLAVSTNIEESDRDKNMDIVGGVYKIDPHVASKNMNQDLNYLKNYDMDSGSFESLDQNGPCMASGHSRFGLANFKHRVPHHPLDPHKAYDIENLPSPTREAPPVLPIDRAFGMVHGAIKPEWPVPRGVLEMEKGSVHPYETDAVKAVSSYQQKFSRTSFFKSDKLPSPTPSEDGDTGNGDMGGEVTSTSFNSNVHPSSTSVMGQPPASTLASTSVTGQPPASTLPIVDLPGQGLINAGNFFPVSSGPIPAVKPPMMKTRDPRLKLASLGAPTVDVTPPSLPMVSTEPRVEPVLEIMNLRKQKLTEEPVLDGPAFKRQRNELTDFVIAKDVEALTGTGGWLEDRGTVGLQVSNSNHVPENVGRDLGRLECAATSIGTGTSALSVTVNRSENLPMPSSGATTSLQSLLKDIAVNPSIWMNIIKMEQQKSTDPMNSSTQPQCSNSILGAVPVLNTVPPKTSALGQKSAGILQTPPQTVTVDESARVRMKRRDPRRVLHGSNVQKGGSIGGDQNKSASSVQRQEDHPVSSHSSTPPDIGRQFMKSLKNIGDIMSVSQAAVVPLVPSTQPVQAHQGRLDKGVPAESGNIGSGATTPSEDVAVGPSRPQSSWGDLEHLFEGFDDKQKAAIQKERARRIEEQKKMFAARKLCLVLDLDHTLLNSAKFVEVDPSHDEMLRKKEEQDREKPQRHLFRFPHMGMWTKLRPGIWNFLEKASKLFELHLYTMGNKLYATEMAKLLDPKGELFAGRVISRGDDGDLIDGDERIPKSKDLEGVLGMESAVVIIDDSVRVWPHNKLNLIVVERYIYFPCSRRQFGLLGPSLLEIDHDERSEDGTLASSLSVIERIHQSFFAHRSLEEADVRNILAAEQRKILAGCRIVFSRVFPVGEANPHLHPLWQTAEQFGAVCTTQIDDQVTHVVANSLGTDKVNWALSTGRFVVHPGWVEASALLYRRANEHDFAIKP